MKKTENIRYKIIPINPAAHHFEVSCTVLSPDPAGQCFSLPAWIPGSYLIRDFARNILSIKAKSNEKPVRLEKINKHTWRADPVHGDKPLVVVYVVYAFELSVRHACLDSSHAFFNGTSMFLRVLGQEESPCLIDIQKPSAEKHYRNWRVATSLPLAKGEKGAAKPYGFGLYRASHYDELIDHPVEMGEFSLVSFSACGTKHDIAIVGRHDGDLERLANDFARICTWQIEFFGKPLPVERYVFIILLSGEGFGGLEHRASTVLICPRHSLPHASMNGLTEDYQTLLSLASHEYFHTWHVKRIKPATFIPYDLDRENYTSLLWIFEGITSYYDDLILQRAGLISTEAWLKLMAKNITTVQSGSGRLRQSLAQSSFDAWIKYYRPDENTPNAVVSYYIKGALFALTLDLTLRHETKGKASLDDVMRSLWQRFGQVGRGMEEDDLCLLAEELSGVRLSVLFEKGTQGVEELPLASLFAAFGISLEWKMPAQDQRAAAILGARLSEADEVRLLTVHDDSPAQKAGLSAGDVIVAVNGFRAKGKNISRLFERSQPGKDVEIHYFRNDEIFITRMECQKPAANIAKLLLKAKANPLRKQWLGE